MDVSRWWRALMMTFDQNHERKCGKSLKMKASYIRNLFHQDRWWIENSTAMFWGDWGKTSGENIQTSGATTPGPWIMTTLQQMRHSLCSSFWFLRIQQSTPTLPTHWTSPCDFFLFLKMKLKFKGQRFDSSEVIQTKLQNAMKKLSWNISRSTSDRGNSAGIPVSMSNGTTSKGMEQIEISVSG